MLRCGIVGLPNVGKSSFFNALTEAAVAAENYPFCTIEPNVGIVPLSDARLDKIAKIAESKDVVPAALRLVDIAGLVKGAAAGDGLGNKFLAHIREVDGIIHVLRCFEDPDVVHVSGTVDPIADAQVVELELALADLATVLKVIQREQRLVRSGDKDAVKYSEVLKKVAKALDNGDPAHSVDLDPKEHQQIKELGLLTIKPVLYCANIGEADKTADNEACQKVFEYAKASGSAAIAASAAFEAELVGLDPSERAELLETLDMKETGIQRLALAAYGLIGLETFFTAGPKEARAWQFKRGSLAPEAAGVIHTDMQRGFIRAETISYDDFIACEGEANSKAAGKLRLEGKDYVVQDGDVMHFRFNV